MALRIGLTGGIGSGKTTVAGIFEVLGIPVYYADDAAKSLMNTDEELKRNISNHFGEESYSNDQLDRKYLAAQVFENPERLALLNSLVHPVTIRDSLAWMQRQKTAYTIKEAALLFEANTAKDFDFIIGVSAPEDVRIDRVMKRDHSTAQQVKQRIGRQLDEDTKMESCDFIIVNDEQHALIPQVLALHKKFSGSIS